MAHGHFFSLPNEVIHQIIDSLHPGDLGSFVLSCKTIHVFSQRAVEKHQELLKQYSTLRFGDPGGWRGKDWRRDHPLLFLRTLLFNPGIAYYPRSLQATQWGDDDDADEPIPEIGNLADVIAVCGSEIATLGEEHPWLKDYAQRQEWRAALQVPTNHSHHLAMLLTMLPNLQSFTMIGMSHHIQPVRETVRAIAAANRDPHSAVHGKALGKLAKIRIDRADSELGEDITLYSSFLGLPSMRSVSGRMIDGKDGDLLVEDPHLRHSVVVPHQIEEINMDYSAIGLDCWEWMLRYIGNLRQFTYRHTCGIVGGAEYYPRSIVALLKKYASHSLEKLHLSGGSTDTHGIHMITRRRVQEQFIGDLKEFQQLRVLILFDTVFRKPNNGEMVRLVDVLPTSIRAVTLINEVQKSDSASLFLGLAEEKEDKLPQLKKLTLYGDFSIQQDLIDELKGVGVEITGWGRQIF
ncbi:MAG: hypothetical protein LQ346_000451 [Caloplaca aetnensis]|nr:MAG: hypothetical protein LQ346_000451 [Caloplaca aetnensis]